MSRIELSFGSVWHDVSSALIKDSLKIISKAMTEERKSTLNLCSFSLLWNEDLYNAISPHNGKIFIKAEYDGREFLGEADPVLDIEWKTVSDMPAISIEAVDFSACLDDKIPQSASYPVVVDGPAFFIFKRDNLQMSILYRLLELCGLSSQIDKDAPDIDVQIKHISWTKGEKTYREIIDELLYEYSFCLMTKGDKVTWFRTAHYTEKHPEVIESSDIIGSISKGRMYETYDGVSVVWPKTRIEEDALLWRGNLPVGDTSNPRPGEPIASGDYWPEDSDIIETWQDYGTEYLDTEYLSGKNRLKNSDISLISSSNWYIKDSKDDGVSLDPIDGREVVYEAHRARLRYRNTTEEVRRLYYSNIYGKALVRYQSMQTSTPSDARNPKTIDASYIYSLDYAERLAVASFIHLIHGCWVFSFKSLKDYAPGSVLELDQDPMYRGYIQILTSEKLADGSITYKALSTAMIEKNETLNSSASSSGGRQEPGQNGSSPRFAYIRSYTKPSKPVGDNPDGWSLDVIPDGSKPVWLSIASFSSTGNKVSDWTDPVRVEGVGGGDYRGTSSTLPEDPLEGDFFIYTGASTSDMVQYHIYKWSSLDEKWVETTESDKVMACQRDALQIAKNTGKVEYCALLFVDLLVAGKLMVGGGTETSGLLCRIMDDDGTGKPIIEIRYNGSRLWWVDVDTGKMYGNFAQIVQYMPLTFDDSLDSSHPATFSFWIPDDADIEWVKIAVKGQKYRTYSTGASYISKFFSKTGEPSFGTQAPSYSISVTTLGYMGGETGESGGHYHSYIKPKSIESSKHSHALAVSSFSMGQAYTEVTEGHQHKYYVPVQTSGNYDDGSHSHTLNVENENTDAKGAHKHTLPSGLVTGVTLNSSGSFSHTHDLDVSHGHDLVLGIIEGESPTNMKLTWAEGSYSKQISVASDTLYSIDINSKKGGWKSLTISSDTLGRVQLQVMCKLRIDTATN